MKSKKWKRFIKKKNINEDKEMFNKKYKEQIKFLIGIEIEYLYPFKSYFEKLNTLNMKSFSSRLVYTWVS